MSKPYDIEQLLRECAEEKIHLIGEVQGFADLIAIDSNFVLKAMSENFAINGMAPKLGARFSELLNSEDLAKLQSLMGVENLRAGSLLDLNVGKFYCYRVKGLLVLERELYSDEIDNTQRQHLFNIIPNIAFAIDSEKELQSAAQNVATAVKNLLGYDRVMIYRFHPDDHGEVIAEEKEKSLEPFINLHYPESDIPQQARALFLRNQVRIIEEVSGKRHKVFTEKGLDLDLSDSICRSAAIVHIEYLQNMGVHGTLTVSLIVDGKLWGLIACHHYSKKFVSFENRSVVKLIGHALSSQISKYETKQLTNRVKKANMITVSLASAFENESLKSKSLDEQFKNSLFEKEDSILSLQRATGFYLEIGHRKVFLGQVPDREVVEYIKKNILDNQASSFFSSSSLCQMEKRFGKYASVSSGAMGVGSVGGESNCLVIWFRPELKEEIKWAGKDDKSVIYTNGHPRLSPRGSFEEVVKVMSKTSLPFSRTDKLVAFEFVWFLNKVLLKQLNFAEQNIMNLEREAIEKDKFISTLSHELRTPLNSILGWMQLYNSKFDSEDEMKELREVVVSNSRQQLNLVNDLLDVSKVATGTIKLDVDTVNLSSLIQKVTQYFQVSFKNKNLKCEVSLEDDLIANIDKTRFQQVLRNILQNAIKFTPKNGCIRVESRKDKSDILIEITDSGVGIEKSELDKIFQKFYQVDSSKSRSKKGMGLGLSLAKSIVELHGGSIDVSSNGVGEGTTVSVKIPISTLRIEKNSERQKSTKYEDQEPLRGKKIMLVEDTPEAARFVKMFLEKKGAVVCWMSDAIQALESLEKNSDYSLVLSDIGLPGMDGLEFVKNARNIEFYKSIPFLALSAYGTNEEASRSLDAGFNEHLVKPIDFESLTSAISRFLK